MGHAGRERERVKEARNGQTGRERLLIELSGKVPLKSLHRKSLSPGFKNLLYCSPVQELGGGHGENQRDTGLGLIP